MLLHADGFDHYGMNAARLLDGVYAQSEAVSLVNVGQRTGTGAIKIQIVYNDSGLRWVLPGDRTTVGMLYAFNLSALPVGPSGLALGQFLDAEGTPLSTLTVLPTGAIEYRDGGRLGEVLAVSAPAVRAGSMQHFECEASFGGGGGIEVRLNGVTVLNRSGLSLTETDACAQVIVGGCYGYPKTGAGAATMIIDDLGVRDNLGAENNSFMGDLKAYTRYPTSDGVEKEWDISTGVVSFEMLNNVPPLDGSEFLSAATAGLRTSVGVDNFPASIVSVAGLVVMTRLWKTDAGNAKVSVQMAQAGAESANAPHPISTAPTWHSDVSQVNPATGAPWLIDDINELELVLDRQE